MIGNSLPSERIAVAGIIAPGALAVGAKNSNWIDLALYTRLMAIISTGVLGAGATVDAKWQVADDSAGLNAVDSPAPAIVQIVKATGDNKQAVMNFDVNRSVPRTKRFARLAVTVAGATSDLGATVLGVDPRHMPATDLDPASVVQVV